MELFDALQTPFVLWTIIVFWAGYMIGKWRSKSARDNDLIGPPSSTGHQNRKTAALPPQNLDHSLAQWAELNPETEAAINKALQRGSKIEAIKILRGATGMGLKESKDAVESRMR